MNREYRAYGEIIKTQNKAGLDLNVTMVNFNCKLKNFNESRMIAN